MSQVPSITTVPIWARAAVAAKAFSVGERRLVSLIQAGEVVGYQAGPEEDARRPWMVDTRSLDKWHTSKAERAQALVKEAVARVGRGIRK